VPALRHGDFRLFETSAITRYIDEAFAGPKLTPSNPAARAVMEQWISVINCYAYDSCVRNYALKYIGPKLRGQEIDRSAIEAGIPNMQRDIARLDGAYAAGAWIAGDALSLADLFVAPIVATVSPFPEGRAALERAKHLSRAFEALSRRPSFQAAHAGLFG
jgi:glutathione S-transferase